MNRLNPTAMALLGGVVVLLLLLFVFTRGGSENADRLSDDQIAAGAATTDPGKACALPATYDLIKRQLFRSAAVLRGSDQAEFARIVPYVIPLLMQVALRSNHPVKGFLLPERAVPLHHFIRFVRRKRFYAVQNFRERMNTGLACCLNRQWLDEQMNVIGHHASDVTVYFSAVPMRAGIE